jgi:hypothetical protein
VAGDGYDPEVTSQHLDRSAGDPWDPHSDQEHSAGSRPDLHSDRTMREHVGTDHASDEPGRDNVHHPPSDVSEHHDAHAVGVDRHVELEDGSHHRIWASNEQLRALESRFAAADAWLAERGLTRADIQPLLVQPADWLNGAQRDLVYDFRHQFPEVESGEGLQKVIDTGQAEGRLSDGPKRYPPDETGGSVSVARDTRGLDTPKRIYDGLALEYDGTPFTSDKPVIAMRFTVDDDVPVHLPDTQLSERAGHGPSFDPGYGYPFTGTGFTASDRFTVPEYYLPAETRMNPGAEMYRINPDGGEELIAVLNPDREWIRIKSNG